MYISSMKPRTICRLAWVVSTLASFFAVLELILYALGHEYLYWPIPKFQSHVFFDLYIWSLNLTDCPIPVSDLHTDHHCASQYYLFGQPWYPLALFRTLSLHSSDHIIFGILIGIAGIFAINHIALTSYSATLRVSNLKHRAAYALFPLTVVLILSSFSFRYALERGQTDIVVLLIIVSGTWFAHMLGKHRNSEQYVILLIALMASVAALTKIYPWLLLPILFIVALAPAESDPVTTSSALATANIRRRHLINAAIILALIIITCALLFDIYSYISQVSFANLTNSGYGLKVLVNAPYSDKLSLSLTSKLFMLAMGFIYFMPWSYICDFFKSGLSIHRITCLISTIRRKSLTELTYAQLLAMNATVISFSVYIVTESFPYKFIIVLLCLPAFVEDIVSDHLVANRSVLSLNILILSMYLPYLAPQPSLGLYQEWFVHFFLHPFLFGLLAGHATLKLVALPRIQAS